MTIKTADLLTFLLNQSEEKMSSSDDTFLEVGGKYLFRSVTMIYSGRIKGIKGNEILLDTAAWIAQTKRWADSLKTCEFEEVEPYLNDVIIYKSSMLDITKLDTLPIEQK